MMRIMIQQDGQKQQQKQLGYGVQIMADERIFNNTFSLIKKVFRRWLHFKRMSLVPF